MIDLIPEPAGPDRRFVRHSRLLCRKEKATKGSLIASREWPGHRLDEPCRAPQGERLTLVIDLKLSRVLSCRGF
jgi:hypothetical protein